MSTPTYLYPYMDFLDALGSISPSLSFDVPLSKHTTFRVGGPASIAVTPESPEELVNVLALVKRMTPSLPICVLGNGSNVLFSDEGYQGLVIFTSKMQNVDFYAPDEDGYVTVTAECGASLTVLSRQCATEGRTLEGLAFAFGIPGTVGGAVVMNAGAYGGEMSDVVYSVDYYDPASGEVRIAFKDDLNFSYRHSLFTEHPEYIVLSATLRMKEGDGETIVNQMATNMTARRLKQPLSLPNAGSVFKRPANHYAGKLIEDSGLKGFRIGGAQVSEKHAGFIVNVDEAKAEDILSLMAHIEHVVKVNFGIELEREIKVISTK